MSGPQIKSLLESTAGEAAVFLGQLADRPVAATSDGNALRTALGGPLEAEGMDPAKVIDTLAKASKSGTVASAGPRYFGFVIGGSLPAALAADWLVSTWDQNAAVYAMSPMVSAIEVITASWLREIAQLPSSMSVGFVTGCQMASFTGLAAARHRVLANVGWDVEDIRIVWGAFD